MKNKNLFVSFKNAFNGIRTAARNERNMKIHIVAAMLIIILSFFFKLSKVEFVIICMDVGIVIICELFNTATEALVDIIVDVYHPKAKLIKDMAAGAVMISAALSVVVAYVVFFDRIMRLIDKIMV